MYFLLWQYLQGITEDINQGNKKIKTLKNQMEAENNKTESVTESAAEDTTTIQADRSSRRCF